MSWPLILLERADKNLHEAFENLEDCQPGLGTKFFRAVDDCLSHIRMFPEIAPPYEQRIRRKVVVPYGYGIFYVVDPSRIIVLDILNLRQDEREIQRQLNS